MLTLFCGKVTLAFDRRRSDFFPNVSDLIPEIPVFTRCSMGAPASDRDRRKASPTMKEFGKRFLAEHVALHCKPSTYGEYVSICSSTQSWGRIVSSTLPAPMSSDSISR